MGTPLLSAVCGLRRGWLAGWRRAVRRGLGPGGVDSGSLACRSWHAATRGALWAWLGCNRLAVSRAGGLWRRRWRHWRPGRFCSPSAGAYRGVRISASSVSADRCAGTPLSTQRDRSFRADQVCGSRQYLAATHQRQPALAWCPRPTWPAARTPPHVPARRRFNVMCGPPIGPAKAVTVRSISPSIGRARSAYVGTAVPCSAAAHQRSRRAVRRRRTGSSILIRRISWCVVASCHLRVS